MDPQLQQSEYIHDSSPDFVADAESPTVKVNFETPGTISKLGIPDATSEQWLQLGEQILDFLKELPAYLISVFRARPLVTTGLVIGAAVSAKLLLAVLGALDDIPLVAPTLEVIGIAYSTWFVYRYLLRAYNRQELATQIQELKEQVVGNTHTNS
ncbi:hypothetical protein DO97_20305 [Neosynechococcus sphagnicola sy1]|uniref:Cyanobacterial aminoacyl-tRNA synthetase CAAD domain-containing protein n=1 Tax=Neosynechococcus sphagnicola sy1 TaxID=1497020 RepID=A0A098TNH7_9CYAN|nr:CAAD domain-containing protein [Neosynechococcus sphagnicola]KGF73422.1 hypothetical protein DO97_20305 [Neosynechococcus sphagnicola sy1]